MPRKQKILRRSDGVIFSYTPALATHDDMTPDYVEVSDVPPAPRPARETEEQAPPPADADEAAKEQIVQLENHNAHLRAKVEQLENELVDLRAQLIARDIDDDDDDDEFAGVVGDAPVTVVDFSKANPDAAVTENVPPHILEAMAQDHGEGLLKTKDDLKLYAKAKHSLHLMLNWKEETMRRKIHDAEDAMIAARGADQA